MKTILKRITILATIVTSFTTSASLGREELVPSTKEVDQQAEDVKYILRLMRQVSSPVKSPERATLALLVAKTGRTLAKGERSSWYILLAVESKFDQTATSSAGAVGIGQVVPLDVKYLNKVTQVSFTKSTLIKSARTNLEVSAGLYKYLKRKLTSRTLTLESYNAGLSSTSIKNIRNISSINLETANYITKHTYLTDVMNNKIEDLATQVAQR